MTPTKIRNAHIQTHELFATSLDALASFILNKVGPKLSKEDISFINREFDLTIQAVLDNGDLLAAEEGMNARQ